MLFIHTEEFTIGKPIYFSFFNEFTPKKKSSGVDNWYLDEFIEEFICGRCYIYLEQTIYHLYRPIIC
jgi:hypothetical protein